VVSGVGAASRRGADRGAIWNRWLGVGLATILAVVTLGLALTGRLALYVNPSSNWFAIPMAVLLLVGAVLSFLLPLGAESDHGHDHGHGASHEHDHEHGHERDRRSGPQPGRRRVGALLGLVGGVAASIVMIAVLALPPAALSASAAQSRTISGAPLFAGADVVQLATHGDTKQFGVGDWANVFANATNTDAFEGDPVTLVGFVMNGTRGGFALGRLMITHCVIDAQPASVPVTVSESAPATGTWVQVEGTVRTTTAGKLEIVAHSVSRVAQPKDPYEY
jgi:uncharacterized repeat protein (TIGR03943 family)